MTTTKAAAKWTRITIDDIAAAVGAAVALELGRECIRSPGAAAVADWWLEDADALGGERLSGALDALAWDTASFFEHLYGAAEQRGAA